MIRKFSSTLLLSASLVAAALASTVAAGEEVKRQSLTDIGRQFESARMPSAERMSALSNVASALDALMDSGVEKNQKSAAHFLSGEIQFSLGEYKQAREDFREAVKKDKNGPFADDAAFAAIIALEAQGDDTKAAKQWLDWEGRYPDSPLRGEVLLARAWNALRRDSLRTATAALADIEANYDHMNSDTRVALAEATLAFRESRFDDALITLERAGQGEGALYLSALCLEASGQMLKAAARYQEVTSRFPQSVFRDPSALAKANVFLRSGAYKSAAEEFARVAESAGRDDVRAEAELRHAACVFLDGNIEAGTEFLRAVATRRHGSDVAARAQLLLGEVVFSQSSFEEAIVEFNRVLTNYFEHELAANAQYQVARCLDALGRHNEATSAYQLVVSGYPQAPQSPAAAYLAGVGLLEQDRPQAAAPYFQLVLDRYASGDEGKLVFASPDDQELVEASLCLLQWSYHKTGDFGRLSGVPHLMLQRMPVSHSSWRAYALLIDADALAAQGRHDEAQNILSMLVAEFPEHDSVVPALRLMAWSHAQRGNDDLAIETEELILERYAGREDPASLASVYLNKAHILFNRKAYEEAATAYDDFVARFPAHEQQLIALYQAGLCQLRLGRTGDAVDRWEALTDLEPGAEIAESAWSRTGDVYFQNEHYENAKTCYQGLIDNFPSSRGAALGTLRLAQCDYNAGRDAEALAMYSVVLEQYPGTGIAAEAARGIERALYRLGQSDGGTEVLASLVEQYPNSAFAADAQFEIASRLFDDKEYEAAAEAFRRVVSQFPGYSSADEAHFLMAESYEHLGATDDARGAYEQFLTFFPTSEMSTTACFRLGSLRFDASDYMRAAINFTTVLGNDAPEELAAASLFNLAMCQIMLSANEEARSALEQYRSSYPNDDRAVHIAYQLGDLHEKAGRYKEAAAEYEQAIAVDSDKALRVELYYRLGTCQEQTGDEKAAAASYGKAVKAGDKTDPFRLSALARSASLHEKSGNYKKAIAAYRDLVANSDDPELALAAKARVEQLEAIAK